VKPTAKIRKTSLACFVMDKRFQEMKQVKRRAKYRKICEPIVEFLSILLMVFVAFPLAAIFFLAAGAVCVYVMVAFFPLSLLLLVPCSGGIVESTSLADAVGWTAWEEKRQRRQDESR